MKLYLIGGLGADKRVFKYLKLNFDTQVIEWISPEPKEALKLYVNRLRVQINTEEDFAILGVSFGGIVAIELAKLLNPKIVFLISSVSSSDQLPKKYIRLGKLKLLNLIPNSLIKPPKFLLGYLFGTKNKTLLRAIINDTEPTFIRWALNSIIKWKSKPNEIKQFRIHGTKDKLIPLVGDAIKIFEGGHFMIVDKAAEISKLVNDQIK